jgi:hypothetical protein
MNLEHNLIPVFIVQTCRNREKYIENIKQNINDIIVNYDNYTNDNEIITSAWKNYLNGLHLAGEKSTVQMDDDIILCENFMDKCLIEIKQRPNEVIQFFSRRNADLTKGSRYELGGNFSMQQCYYLPNGMAKKIYQFGKEYEQTMTEKGCPTDIMMASYFKQNKIKYWVVVPNLVDHIEGVSAIDKRRSSKRQSLTFKS